MRRLASEKWEETLLASLWKLSLGRLAAIEEEMERKEKEEALRLCEGVVTVVGSVEDEVSVLFWAVRF